MTAVDGRRDDIAPTPADEEPDRPPSSVRGQGLLGLLTSTDHKVIGLMYIVTALGFFLLGGALATVVRVELYSPGTQVVEPGAYNQVFTMHGSVMIYLFIVPMAFGLANYLVPLHIGAKEMAFPRLNALGYWLFLFGGLTMVSGFLTADGPAA
ncbi:MAG TPA: cbb3-type cytochrome c oxidase subunit I, partial [Acidimicrobiales bacterium]|nr:cbb3-type cytochrome c oxidase subunit I [Acidimicrobiales bacterium]